MFGHKNRALTEAADQLGHDNQSCRVQCSSEYAVFVVRYTVQYGTAYRKLQSALQYKTHNTLGYTIGGAQCSLVQDRTMLHYTTLHYTLH